jgi:hypothetical protein
LTLFDVVDSSAVAVREGGGALLVALLEVGSDCQSVVLLVEELVFQLFGQILLFCAEDLSTLTEIIANIVDQTVDPRIEDLHVLLKCFVDLLLVDFMHLLLLSLVDSIDEFFPSFVASEKSALDHHPFLTLLPLK